MKLIIVESPAKAKKIQSFFNDVIVKSSFGHINNLDFKKLDEMISKNFTPIYINTPGCFYNRPYRDFVIYYICHSHSIYSNKH